MTDGDLDLTDLLRRKGEPAGELRLRLDLVFVLGDFGEPNDLEDLSVFADLGEPEAGDRLGDLSDFVDFAGFADFATLASPWGAGLIGDLTDLTPADCLVAVVETCLEGAFSELRAVRWPLMPDGECRLLLVDDGLGAPAATAGAGNPRRSESA